MFTRFIYLCLFWFRIVYLHPGFVYLHFSMFVYRISALFTNTGLFIYVFQCLYAKFPLCLQTLVCLFTSSVFVYFWNVNKRVADSLHDFLKFAFVGW